ncbi:hypothetical protein J2S97_003592 [Arthrobacter oryzae]|nr:hypothetical protein [Arthrobacter oryzae]
MSVRADILVVAGNRSDTVVNVQPRTAARALDARVAEQTTVDFSDGRLQVRLRPLRRYSWFGDGGAVDITVEVPIGSSLELKSGMGDLRCEGEFTSADLKTEMGYVRIDRCTDLRVHTGMGDVTVERVAGRAEIKTGSGKDPDPGNRRECQRQKRQRRHAHRGPAPQQASRHRTVTSPSAR